MVNLKVTFLAPAGIVTFEQPTPAAYPDVDHEPAKQKLGTLAIAPKTNNMNKGLNLFISAL